MKSFEVYSCRRVGLRWSREFLAEKAGVTPNHVKWFEEGKLIGRDFENKIKDAINLGYRELDSIEHYKARIMELSYEIRYETDVQQLMQRIGHMQVELGKLQMEIMNNK